MRRAMVCLSVLALMFLSGCGGDPLKRQPVSGTVTYQGKLLEYGSLEFVPDPESGATKAGAEIKAGKYQIPKDKGLAPGKYVIRFSSPDHVVNIPGPPGSGDEGTPPYNVLSPKHCENSTHKAEVKVGTPNVFNFDLD